MRTALKVKELVNELVDHAVLSRRMRLRLVYRDLVVGSHNLTMPSVKSPGLDLMLKQ